jgi:hypothetical protein
MHENCGSGGNIVSRNVEIARQQCNQQIRETEWKVHEELLAKSREMLAWPLCEIVVSKDGLTTIIKPCRWRLVDTARMVETAFKLAMLALGASTRDASGKGTSIEPIINVRYVRADKILDKSSD